MRIYKVLAAFLVVSLSACQMAPTKIIETQKREFSQVVEKAQKPIVVTGLTVVLDVRSRFDYGLNHVANSILFPWHNLAESQQSGELLKDQRQAAMRLALLGLNPQTPVVIVGNGLAGQGEEGRLAWNLLYLGFQDVQVSSIEAFRKVMTPSDTPPVLNEKSWSVHAKPSLQIDKTEFLKWAKHPKERLESHVHIIDVRSEKEFLGAEPDVNAINIEWKHFFTDQGRPDPIFKNKLAALGIGSIDQIILISSHGVRSAAVTYALLALGFSKVQNFTPGWNSL